MPRLLPPLGLILALTIAACGPPAPSPIPTVAPSPASTVLNPGCGPLAKDDGADSDPSDDNSAQDSQRHPPGGLPQLLPTPGPAAPGPSQSLRVETVVDNVGMPLGLAWTPDGRKLFFSEVKLGRIRVVADGVLQPEPFVELPIAKGSETGMLGLALDPDYATNRYVYAYWSDPQAKRNKVVRFEDRNGRAGGQTEILSAVAVSEVGAHNGGRLAFGPDRMLYVTVGNGQSTKTGQDPCKLGGKVLRVTKDGQRPDDSPFAGSSALALGFRNPFGLAIHPLTGAIFVTDNGGKGVDELDLVRKGANYGHPIVEGSPADARFVDPLWHSGPVSIGPTGLTFYTGDRLPEFKNDLFFCGVHTGQLSRLRLAPPAYDRVESMSVELLKDQVDCRLDVANGPDGALYFTNFSKIMRITR